MTNKEIKFELSKVALTKCNFMTSESLTESLTNLYDWITEEPVQKPADWSEEDEQTFIKAVEALEDFGKFELADWLKEHKNED